MSLNLEQIKIGIETAQRLYDERQAVRLLINELISSHKELLPYLRKGIESVPELLTTTDTPPIDPMLQQNKQKIEEIKNLNKELTEGDFNDLRTHEGITKWQNKFEQIFDNDDFAEIYGFIDFMVEEYKDGMNLNEKGSRRIEHDFEEIADAVDFSEYEHKSDEEKSNLLFSFNSIGESHALSKRFVEALRDKKDFWRRVDVDGSKKLLIDLNKLCDSDGLFSSKYDK